MPLLDSRDLDLDAALDEEDLEREAPAAWPGKRTLVGRLIERMLPLGAGRPLPTPFREELERATGLDLGDVRVKDAPLAGDLGVSALTLGRDIFLAPGRGDPSSGDGRKLLAHEVAHAIQQRGADRSRVEATERGDAFEADAHAFADRFVAGGLDPGSLTPLARSPFLAVAADPAHSIQHMYEAALQQYLAAATPPPGGGPQRGSAFSTTVATAQIVDPSNQMVAEFTGLYGNPRDLHAEDQVLRWAQNLPEAQRRGNRLIIFVTEPPCPAQCTGLLTNFRNQRGTHGLELNVFVPAEQNRLGGVSRPRTTLLNLYFRFRRQTASRPPAPVATTQFSELPEFRSSPYGGPLANAPAAARANPRGPGPYRTPQQPAQQQPPPAGGGGGQRRNRRGGGPVRNRLRNPGGGVPALTIRTGTMLVTGVLAVLDAINDMNSAMSMMNNGTIFEDAQRQARTLTDRAHDLDQAWAVAVRGTVYNALSEVIEAGEAADDEALLDLHEDLDELIAQLQPIASECTVQAASLHGRALGMRRYSDALLQFAQVAPMFMTSAPHANALLTSQSLILMAGTLEQAERYYDHAATLLTAEVDDAVQLRARIEAMMENIANGLRWDANLVAAPPAPPVPDAAP